MERAKLKSRKYKNVMPRVTSQSDSNLKPKYAVTTHPSTRSGAKPISSSISNTSGFCDLPIALNDYTCESTSNTVKRRTFVVKPKKTIKSFMPAVPPSVLKHRNTRETPNIYSRYSAPTVLSVRGSESILNGSTNEVKKLKELKDEIKDYHEKERTMRFCDSLNKKFGLTLGGGGEVAVDKGVQVDGKDSDAETTR